MNRDTRTIIVLLVAIITAAAASYGVYSAVERMPVREVEVAHSFVVTATRTLPTGTRVAASDLKLVAWPNSAPVPGAFSKVEEVVDRGLIVAVQENEPITQTKVAPKEAGAGLSPTIPAGMRAISVRVNEVIGVAGFVLPGTKVDVYVTLQKAPESLTRVVVSNVQVLTAGTRYDQEEAKDGEPVESSVVTLLLTPADAERVVLASAEGGIMLALRNPLDNAPTTTTGTRTAGLFGDAPPVVKPAAAPRPKVVNLPPPPPPPAEPVAPVYKVETIRAAQRGEETIR
jgi:pilus assembly protein CpaB